MERRLPHRYPSFCYELRTTYIFLRVKEPTKTTHKLLASSDDIDSFCHRWVLRRILQSALRYGQDKAAEADESIRRVSGL